MSAAENSSAMVMRWGGTEMVVMTPAAAVATAVVDAMLKQRLVW